jgi:murein DD-endopeptidase MepM/ murein hydrolase activator NlpD
MDAVMMPLGSEGEPRASRFSQYLVACNGLERLRFKEWVFHPGMLFGSAEGWAGLARRDRLHEGVDFLLYRQRDGETFALTAKTRIPAMYDGEVVRIHNDFMGQSIWVRHNMSDGGRRLCTAYGHTLPAPSLGAGDRVSEGQVIATVGDGNRKGLKVPPHLHLSVAWVSEDLPRERLGWEAANDPRYVALLDPLKLIACRYSIVGPAL